MNSSLVRNGLIRWSSIRGSGEIQKASKELFEHSVMADTCCNQKREGCTWYVKLNYTWCKSKDAPGAVPSLEDYKLGWEHGEKKKQQSVWWKCQKDPLKLKTREDHWTGDSVEIYGLYTCNCDWPPLTIKSEIVLKYMYSVVEIWSSCRRKLY